MLYGSLKTITIFQGLAGDNVCIVAIALCVVGTDSHLIITIRVQVCQVSTRTLHI